MLRFSVLWIPFDLRSHTGMDVTQFARQLGRVSIEQRDSPDILSNFQSGNAIMLRLDERRLECGQPALQTDKKPTETKANPNVHLSHRTERHIKWHNVVS